MYFRVSKISEACLFTFQREAHFTKNKRRKRKKKERGYIYNKMAKVATPMVRSFLSLSTSSAFLFSTFALALSLIHVFFIVDIEGCRF